MKGNTPLVVFSVCLASALTAGVAHSQVIVDAQGFEAPDYSTTFNGTGDLEGQPSGSSGPWLLAGPAGSTAVVQSSVVDSGSQAVRVDRGANSDDRWAVPVSGYPTGQFITTIWSMRVDHSGAPGGVFGPLFGIEAYDFDGGVTGLLGSLLVDSSTGDVLYQAQGTGVVTETGVVVNFGEWNRFAIELDYVNSLYRIFMNDFITPLQTEGFVDPGLTDFTDSDIAALAGAADSVAQAQTATAYFDNFVVYEGQVPEPAGAVLMGLGATALGLRRRR